MPRSREADSRAPRDQSGIVRLAREIRRAQELRDAEVARASRDLEKGLEGSVRHAAEYLKTIQKADAAYERAIARAFKRYRTARAGAAAGPRGTDSRSGSAAVLRAGD